MQTLHKTLEETLGKLPEIIFEQLLEEKLKDHGVYLSRRRQQQLLKQILSGKFETLRLKRWQWWKDEHVAIEFTEEDIENIELQIDYVLDERLPQIIENITQEIAASTIVTLKQRWDSESQRQRREYSRFQRNLNRRWGEPIGLLRMLLTISQECGAHVNEQLRDTHANSEENLVEVLTRLHARACQVVDEILVLLTTGFADGAMARWRTLHEIAVVALFIGKHGEGLAERYILHQIVESRHAMRDYINCQERLGYEPIKDEEIADVEQAYDDVIERFCKPFGTQYGWAAHQLEKNNPTFKDIEHAVGIDHLRAHYRLASHNVHANPKGVFFKLGLLKESDLLLAGPSDAGLADPGHNAAISLLQTTTPLLLLRPTLDNIIALQVLDELESEIGRAFGDAHQQLVDDTA